MNGVPHLSTYTLRMKPRQTSNNKSVYSHGFMIQSITCTRHSGKTDCSTECFVCFCATFSSITKGYYNSPLTLHWLETDQIYSPQSLTSRSWSCVILHLSLSPSFSQLFLSSVYLSLLLSPASEVVVITDIQVNVKGFPVAVSIRGEHVLVECSIHTDG